MRKVGLGILTGIIVFIIGFISCTERIDAGHEGIVVKLYGSDRGVQDISLATGRVWYNPLTEEVYEFPTFVQTVDYEPFTVNAKDGSVFTVDPTFSFNIQPGATPKIFTKYRKNIQEITNTTLYNYVKDAFRIQMNKYTTEELISNQQQFENDVQKTLDSVLIKDGFHLEQLTS
jgi:regulator of protease activity HflC (stomatin/prohibitin superfamily)